MNATEMARVRLADAKVKEAEAKLYKPEANEYVPILTIEVGRYVKGPFRGMFASYELTHDKKKPKRIITNGHFYWPTMDALADFLKRRLIG